MSKPASAVSKTVSVGSPLKPLNIILPDGKNILYNGGAIEIEITDEGGIPKKFYIPHGNGKAGFVATHQEEMAVGLVRDQREFEAAPAVLSSYDGNWKDGKMHGLGTFQKVVIFTQTSSVLHPTHESQAGYWHDGRFVGDKAKFDEIEARLEAERIRKLTPLTPKQLAGEMRRIENLEAGARPGVEKKLAAKESSEWNQIMTQFAAESEPLKAAQEQRRAKAVVQERQERLARAEALKVKMEEEQAAETRRHQQRQAQVAGGEQVQTEEQRLAEEAKAADLEAKRKASRDAANAKRAAEKKAQEDLVAQQAKEKELARLARLKEIERERTEAAKAKSHKTSGSPKPDSAGTLAAAGKGHRR